MQVVIGSSNRERKYINDHLFYIVWSVVYSILLACDKAFPFQSIKFCKSLSIKQKSRLCLTL